MLSKLSITNFKCFQQKEINFAPLTVLVGGNASGKSTVIQALLLIRQSIERTLSAVSLKTDFLSEKPNFSEQFDLPLNGFDLLQLGSADAVLSNIATSRNIQFRLEGMNGQIIAFSYILDSEDSSHLLKGKLKDFSSGNNSDIILKENVSYLNAERMGPRKALELGASQLDVGPKGEYTSYVIHKADVERIEVHDDLKLEFNTSRFSHQVEAWLQMIIPGQRMGYRVLSEVTMASLDYNDCSPPNTGFGISYVLPIIVSGLLLSKLEKSILIVENPEAHLHPYGQSMIGRFLAKLALTGIQVIIETHSEHVVNGARVEMARSKASERMNINFFTKVDDDVHIEQLTINAFGEISNWPQGFFDQTQRDLKELFLLKKEGALKK